MIAGIFLSLAVLGGAVAFAWLGRSPVTVISDRVGIDDLLNDPSDGKKEL